MDAFNAEMMNASVSASPSASYVEFSKFNAFTAFVSDETTQRRHRAVQDARCYPTRASIYITP